MEYIPLIQSYALQQAGEWAASKLTLYMKARELMRQQVASKTSQGQGVTPKSQEDNQISQ